LAIAVGFVVIGSVSSAAMPCWCCTKGKVTHVPVVVCQQGGGHCYATQSQANKACGIRNPDPRPNE
jgi:hypothetical protein